jgi:hypothetical protein
MRRRISSRTSHSSHDMWVSLGPVVFLRAGSMVRSS